MLLKNLNQKEKFSLSEDKEVALWKEFKGCRDEENKRALKNFFLEKYAPLVKHVAGKMACRVPANVNFDDLVGYGTLGLLDAVGKFDPQVGVKFKTYAMTRIQGQMYDELRSLDWVPRTVRQKHRRIEEIKQNYREQNKVISNEEIAEQIGISVSEVERMSNLPNDSNFISIDDEWSLKKNDDTISIKNTIEAPRSLSPERMLEIGEMQQLVKEELQKLPEKEKKVLVLYYFEELTLKEIGTLLEVTESRVSQLHSKAIRNIRASLDKLKKNLE